MAPKSKVVKAVDGATPEGEEAVAPKAKRAKVTKPDAAVAEGVGVGDKQKATSAPKGKAAPKGKSSVKPKAGASASSGAQASSAKPSDVSNDDDLIELETQFQGDDRLAWLLSQGELTVEAIAATYKVSMPDAKAIFDQVQSDFEMQFGDDIEFGDADVPKTQTPATHEPNGEVASMNDDTAGVEAGKPPERSDSQRTEWFSGCKCF